MLLQNFFLKEKNNVQTTKDWAHASLTWKTPKKQREKLWGTLSTQNFRYDNQQITTKVCLRENKLIHIQIKQTRVEKQKQTDGVYFHKET